MNYLRLFSKSIPITIASASPSSPSPNFSRHYSNPPISYCFLIKFSDRSLCLSVINQLYNCKSRIFTILHINSYIRLVYFETLEKLNYSPLICTPGQPSYLHTSLDILLVNTIAASHIFLFQVKI